MTMKYYCFFLLMLWSSLATLTAQNAEAYQYKVDLNRISNDALIVDLIVPSSITQDNPTFYFPRIIPGTYEISNYGRFVSSLKAYDKRGNEVPVERQDENTWKINGKKIAKISYKLDDTWDADVHKKDAVFEASGSNFEAGKNFVLCANACFGFFEGTENLPFEVTFDRPSNFYATTSLNRFGGDFDSDIFLARNYHDLVDAPIMYCIPDTVNFKLGYGDIQISVYSPNGIVTAKDIYQEIGTMLNAQIKYMGNILPVDRYAFMIYLSPDGYKSGNVGALEHARSSVFCLTEEKADKISKLVVDIASHEFFHMITPLYIHSEEIHNFDYINPKMSKHLWLYEGVIEYMAQHMQAKHDLITDEDFLARLRNKIKDAGHYKQGISLAEMSKKCLIEPYSKQYNNIYYKGAIVAMCLDLELMSLSEGKYDIQMLLRDLSGYYGEDLAFKDDELYEKIIAITGYRQLGKFFERYVEGTETLPYDKFVEPFGIEYLEEAEIMEISSLGGIENGVVKPDSLDRFFISKAEKLDKFGKEGIKFQQDDIILKWNDKKLTARTVSGVLFTYMNSVKAGDVLEIEVLRDGKPLLLSTTVTPIPVVKQHVFKMIDNPTPQQLALRKRWLTPTE